MLGLVFAGSVWAEEDGLPDMAFLEYLGMWEAADEEAWQLLAEDDDELSSEESNRDDGSDALLQGEVPESEARQEFENEH